jgi:diguanylate cyclase (GGDEF)-like protein/PAS domain S-box-containing protein
LSKKQNKPDQLRITAEARLARESKRIDDIRSTQEILHELHVHQIELEMQNEELRAAKLELEESHEHYLELYDFAPVGYLTLNIDGKIEKANLTAAKLLGGVRSKLIQRNFNHFVAHDNQDEWRRHLFNMLAGDNPLTIELSLLRDSGSLYFYGRLECMLLEQDGEVTGIRIALSDITKKHSDDEALRESEALLRDSHFLAGLGSYVLFLSTGLWKSSEMLDEIFGIDEQYNRTIEGWAALIHPDDRQSLVEYLKHEVIENGRLFDKEYRIIRHNDLAERWVHGMGKLQMEAKGRAYKMLGTIQDITVSKLAEADSRIAAIAFESQEGMVITDIAGTILRVNSAYTAITGYTSAEVIGKNPRIMQSGRHDKNFYDAMWKTVLNKGSWEGEVWNKRKNAEIFPEHLMITAVKDAEGMTTNYVGTLTDITVTREAANQIQHLAFYDVLTRLPNRRLLMDRLSLALAASLRSGKEGALLFLDLDNFKTLNDTLGHETGDQLLQQAAQRLESTVREGDTVARLGGDEFVVMLENLSSHRMEAAAQTEAIGAKVLSALNQTYQLGMHKYHCTTSIGSTLFGDHKTDIDELLKQADIAMYQAKKAGRNTLRFFDLQMQANINARVALETQLRNAIEKREFVLYYQVQVDHKRRALGAEALIRWEHTELGFISPAQFISLAEETGLILSIGQWVLESACAQLKAWQNNGLTREFTLSVNVSAKQFHEANFVLQVQETVKHYAINPALLKLEPTESVLLEDIDATVETMNALRAIGVHFALDDFGTGFSSLQYLKKLPLNQLKIDQTFVRDLVTDNNDQAIVRTIIAMAQSMNLQVIAEGVETEEQLLLLQQSGCKHYQGYLFGKPVPIEQFEASLTQSNELS